MSRRTRQALTALRRYMLFFLSMCFVVTCCMLMFLKNLAADAAFTEAAIEPAARLTFANVILLSVLCTVVDAVQRKFTVERPVKRIISAAERIMQGDFSARIEPSHYADGFDTIIECFNKMSQELAGLETLRTDFIANVSHELKTPLAVMQNYGTMLKTPGLTEEERTEYAGEITAASRRLADMISNILKLNKLENQQILSEKETYNLGEQLCECLLSFESVWEEKDILIDTDIEEDVLVETDREMMTLVWNNLFSNAIKFTDKGGAVGVRLKTDGSMAVIEVSDTGCGIRPEVGAHIFEKFYQSDTSHAAEGNGLGLALVKRVMDIAGGDITVTSEVGKGSTFSVRIRRKV